MGVIEPKGVDGLIKRSREAQRRGDFDAMLQLATQASEADPGNLVARFRVFECLLYCGRPDQVRSELAVLEAGNKLAAPVLAKVAEFYTHCVDFPSAHRCLLRALERAPDNAEYRFALAAAEIALGNMEAAEQQLDAVIASNPHDYDAYRNRASLRHQQPDDNHVDQILALLQAGPKNPSGEVQLCYALAKEYADLGDHPRAFAYLKRGADRRRALMNYRVEGDLQVFDRLVTVFDQTLMQGVPSRSTEPGPIFVLGLPRSGTTLVDRVLSSHSQVASLGEINNFAYALMHTVGQAADKLTLIDLSARIDFARLGERYANALRRYGPGEPFLIDKTPLNYLYVGLICLALPQARIVHVQRQVMDSCFGMYRELFRAGYPFTYDFSDLARYYAGYRRLLDHWYAVLPEGRMLTVRYEDLVDDLEAVSRNMVDYCGLAWESACLEFHTNRSPVATASSAQVRRPVYRDALNRWRRYEHELQPLVKALQREGIPVAEV